jgi:hypothetical protein
MELTEEFLIRIASHIAILNTQVQIMREVLVQMGAQPEALDQAIEQGVREPSFQRIHALVLEDLRASLSLSD